MNDPAGISVGGKPARSFALDAARRFRQAGVLTRLLRRSVGEQLVQVLAVALVRTELLADGLGQYAHGGSDLVLFVIFTQEVDHFPMVLGQVAIVDLGHFLGDILVPVDTIYEITFFVGLGRLSTTSNRHVYSPRRLFKVNEIFRAKLARWGIPPPGRQIRCSRPA